MPVLEAVSVTLEVPRLEEGIKFYTDAGLKADSTESVSRLRCAGQHRDAIVLLGGAPRKRCTTLPCARITSKRLRIARQRRAVPSWSAPPVAWRKLGYGFATLMACSFTWLRNRRVRL